MDSGTIPTRKSEEWKRFKELEKEVIDEDTRYAMAWVKNELNFWMMFKDKFFMRPWEEGLRLHEVREIHVNDRIAHYRAQLLRLEEDRILGKRRRIRKRKKERGN